MKPLAEQAGSTFVMPCDVEDIASVDAVFAEIKKQWGTMDFLVHAIAFSDKNELKGRYADSTRENFIRTMVISCYAFTEAAKRAAALMPNGGSMVTLTYNGGERAMPNYNVMGVAKAGLEASVRYLAVDFGHQKIRVNAISAGPIRTLAGAGITDARYMFAFQQKYSPLGRGVTLEELGGAGLYLLSDLSTGVTGEVHFVDSGYNVISMPQPDALKSRARRSGQRRRRKVILKREVSALSLSPCGRGWRAGAIAKASRVRGFTFGADPLTRPRSASPPLGILSHKGRGKVSSLRSRTTKTAGEIPGRFAFGRSRRRDQARSKRSAFITLVQAATKSFANFSLASAQA